MHTWCQWTHLTDLTIYGHLISMDPPNRPHTLCTLGVSGPTSVTVLTTALSVSLCDDVWSLPPSSFVRLSLALSSVPTSDMRSTSHHGDAPPHSDAVWNEDDLDGVQVHSDAVTKSSSDLLSSADRVLQEVFRVAHHSCEQTGTDSNGQQVCCDRSSFVEQS